MRLLFARTIIIVIAVMFVSCGLLHLLVRCLIKKKRLLSSSNSHLQSSRFQEGGVDHDAFETQLQQLFNLHDSGLDQDFIDALPVFSYKELMGLKEPFDCAVCLCEFTLKDSLRLLPLCSHAFHMYCIDIWLLSNSTCPLCRGSLFGPGFSVENPGFEFNDLREENVVDDGQGHFGHFERCESNEKRVYPVRLGSLRAINVGKGEEKEAGETSFSNFEDDQGHVGHFKHSNGSISNEMRMYPVRLGSFRATNVGKGGETEAGETSNSNFDDGDDRQGQFGHLKRYDGSAIIEKRVCIQGYSGHFKQPEASVGDEKKVCGQGRFGHFKQCDRSIVNEKRVYPVKLGKFRATNVEKGKEKEAGETSNSNVDARRCYSMGTYEYVVANSELRVEFVPSKSSRGSFGNKDNVDSSNDEGNNGKKISSRSKGESFSVSKIWLWSKNQRP